MFGMSTHKRIAATMAADATISSAIKVKGFNHVHLEIPTLSVGLASGTADVWVHGCDTETGTFRRMRIDGTQWCVTATTGNLLVFCDPAALVDYIKIETSNTATASVGLYVHVHN